MSFDGPVQPYTPLRVGFLTGRIALLLLAALIVGGAAACGQTSPAASASTPTRAAAPTTPTLDRHGLPANIPLPNGVTFVRMLTVTKTSGETDNEWLWTVASPNDPPAVQSFYQNNLPTNGWTNLQSGPNSTGALVVGGCQNGAILGALIETAIPVGDNQGNVTTVTAPAGGSALELITTTDAAVVAANCL